MARRDWATHAQLHPQLSHPSSLSISLRRTSWGFMKVWQNYSISSMRCRGRYSFWTVTITAWQIDGEKVETVTDFIFLGSQIAIDGDCLHEIKRRLLLGRKAMTNLDSILKNRDFMLPTKIHIVKAMIFPVVMYECQCWTMKKAECWRTDVFQLWCEDSWKSIGQQGDQACLS